MFDFTPGQGLWGLFASAFISATLLPGASEAVLVAVIARHAELFWPAIGVATLGNTLGGMTSYLIGRVIPPARQEAALARVRRHGAWVLLLSWVPVVGDALCVAAGWLRLPWGVSVAAIALGKGVRYLVVAAGWVMLW